MAVAAAVFVVCGAGLFVSVLSPGSARADCVTLTSPQTTVSGAANFGKWTRSQVSNAAAIVAAGQRLKVPPRGWVVALATAMQESTLRMLANSKVPRSLDLPHEGIGLDHDSVGLFQQRPLPPDGQGRWGTVPELMNPQASAEKFYSALLRVGGWQDMSLPIAAQAVQRSAFPGAYAKWENDAALLAAHVAGLSNIELVGGGPPGAECGPPDAGTFVVSPGGWTQPVKAKFDRSNSFRSLDRPDHDGVDLMAARFTPIRAAAAGKVTVMTCNASTGNCDVDGSPSVKGCGWYIEIAHNSGAVTRYCHMARQPSVKVGDTVTAGHIVGYVGSSGNSSGPHLHFEVHLGAAAGTHAASSNAVDPVQFMETNGAPLGPDPR
ncbi:MAG: M23 family metallopeptidase [Longispora sp.]|nr:M23 family metallopeptidase [Longispora sp. (in: high G+C Gram-positive bacteria)]